MKDTDHNLTLQETEALCRMYLDCRLSVFEETELQYVLLHSAHRSPLIDDVRALMMIEPSVARVKPKSYRLYFGIAASVALLLGIGIPLFINSSKSAADSDGTYYIAYSHGRRLSDEEARRQAEAAIKESQEFMKEMAEIEARDKQMIKDFTNFINSKYHEL